MCGIVGYVGNRNATDVLLSGLKKLEYRGYDSCGIATILNEELKLHKTIKGIENLYLHTDELEKTNIGIGHTRWATHGGVYEKNSHPHIDNGKRFAVVHNGIIENYLELKDMLMKNGYVFYSETDTEVIPNLIAINYEDNLLEAVEKTTKLLKGSYAIAVIDKFNEEEIVVTKRNSPLIVGIGNNENFVASDFSALLKYTNQISVLENNEFAVLDKEKILFYDENLNLKNHKIKNIEITDEDTEKNGYEHFMLKEINENTITVKNILNSYIKNDEIVFKLNFSKDYLKSIKHIHIVACGTAMHAGLNAKYIIEKLTRIFVSVEVASEFRYSEPILDKDDLVIFISQSGETADTIASLELVKEKRINHLSIVNVKESTIDRLSDNVIYTLAGSEVAVASTKAYVAQVTVLNLFAIYLCKERNMHNLEKLNKLISEIKEIPSFMQEAFEKDSEYLKYANTIYSKKDVFYLGRGLDYYVAMEGSLKLKEISYIHSEAFQFGELKHGSIALIEEGVPAIVLSTNESLLEKVISNIKEIKARGANVLILTTLEKFPLNVADEIIRLPNIDEIFSSLITVIPLQLIAYYVAVLKKLDVDKPRNLAKSVTVE